MVPRTAGQREHLRTARLPSVIVPPGAVDAQSLIALADLVVSAGGTMNREAVALGTPVYSTFAGRLGGVDEQLLRAGRLRMLTNEDEIELVKQAGRARGRPPRPPRCCRPHPRSRGSVQPKPAMPTLVVKLGSSVVAEAAASCAPACSSASATRSRRSTARASTW